MPAHNILRTHIVPNQLPKPCSRSSSINSKFRKTSASTPNDASTDAITHFRAAIAQTNQGSRDGARKQKAGNSFHFVADFRDEHHA